MHFHLPLHLSRKRNLINLHLFERDWQSAIAEIERHPHDCQAWSNKAGFFDGDHESRVLPIHVACSLRAPLEVVRAIVDAYPGCLSTKDGTFKRLPLHVACQFSAPSGVIEHLSREYPAGTLEPDTLGRLAIHYACSNGAPVDVVTTLLRANPAATLYADYNGWLPLHVAVHFGGSTEVVREMVRVCPAAVSMRTEKSSTALSLARKVRTKNRDEVIAVLSGDGMVGTNDARQSSIVRRVSMAA